MMRRRLLAAAVGAGVVLAALPALADVEPGGAAVPAAEAEALALLERAADAGRRLTYSGTQYVASWRGSTSSSSLVELEHDPYAGSVLRAVGGSAEGVTSTAVLDPRMLQQLAAGYDLEVSGPGRCAGRAVSVVEARTAGGDVAGRFWVDRATGVLLRREVFDDDGRRVRSSAFLDFAVADRPPASPRVPMGVRTADQRPAGQAVQRLRREGWHVPQELPRGFRLFQTRRDGEVLQLAYTDGLSTLSLFEQSGQLGSNGMAGFRADRVGGRPAWFRGSAPERVVWSGGDRVWTLVSDAPDATVRAAVAVLPRDPAPDNGLGARLGRGLSRLGGMLNPFG